MTLPSDLAPVRSLIEYLKTEVPVLNDITDEFPNHGDELKMPCASLITVGTPKHLNLMPYTFKSEEDPENELNDLVYEVIGQYDGSLQLDIWSEYKIQRSELMEKILDALNKEYINSDKPCGLSLIMPDYHNAIARFDYVGYTYISGEDAPKKTEWRVKAELLFCSPEIKVRSIPRIKTIELDTNINDNDNDNEEIVTTF